jgi:probable HAF family extracellular repeat protein
MTTIQKTRVAAALATLFLACSAAQAAATYTFKALDSFGGSWSVANAVNAAGTVVGVATQTPNNDDPPMEPTRPVRWTTASTTDLGVIDSGPYGNANGINDAGLVVGTSFLPNTSGVRATLWNGTSITDLGTLGGTESQAYGINKSGVIVGYSMTRLNKRTRATIWKNGSIKALKDLGGYAAATAISNSGYVVGYAAASDSRHAVVWKRGVLTDLGTGWGTQYAQANGVNNVGVVVGQAPSANGPVHAMKWVGAAIIDLGTLGGGDYSWANGVNDVGDIVGASWTEAGCCETHATLWRDGAAIDLNDLIDPSVRDAGWILIEAKAIDRVGHISGNARNVVQNVSRAFLLKPVR